MKLFAKITIPFLEKDPGTFGKINFLSQYKSAKAWTLYNIFTNISIYKEERFLELWVKKLFVFYIKSTVMPKNSRHIYIQSKYQNARIV